MRINPTSLLWAVIFVVSIISSLKDKWGNNSNKRASMNDARQEIDEKDVEMPIEQTLRNRRERQQRHQVVSENIETDFGEELLGDTLKMEETFLEAPVSESNPLVEEAQWSVPMVEKQTPRSVSKRPKARKLRQAVLYYEILSKPKSLR